MSASMQQVPPYLVNEHFGDRYFDIVDAMEEANHVFFRGTDLMEILSSEKALGKELRIGETGFGAGRLLIALMDMLERSGMRNLAIAYHSVELHPIAACRMASILGGFRDRAGDLIDLLVDAYGTLDLTEQGWKRLRFNRVFGVFSLNLWIGEALEMVRALREPCDLWFLDGHGPKTNPSIWREELLLEIGRKTVPGGTCATFTVAVAVRKGLADAGFAVEQRPGFGIKKSVLKGVKPR